VFKSGIALFSLVLALSSLSCGREAEREEPPSGDAPPPFTMILACPAAWADPAGFPAGMVRRVDLEGSLDAAARAAVMAAAGEARAAAVIVAPAPSGTAALFAELRLSRPELRLVAFSPEDATLAIEAAADLVLGPDAILLAWGIAKAAAELGAEVLVSVRGAGPGPAGTDAAQSAERAAAGIMGLRYLEAGPAEDGADPLAAALAALGDAGSGDRARTAVTGSGASLAMPLLEAAAGAGLLYVEGRPPATGYDGTPWDPVRYLGVAAALAASRGGSGKALIWPWVRPEPLAAAALEHVRRVVDGSARMDDAAALAAACSALWPAGGMRVEWHVDPASGVRARNHLLVSGDAYVLGRGYLPSALEGMPASLRTLGPETP